MFLANDESARDTLLLPQHGRATRSTVGAGSMASVNSRLSLQQQPQNMYGGDSGPGGRLSTDSYARGSDFAASSASMAEPPRAMLPPTPETASTVGGRDVQLWMTSVGLGRFAPVPYLDLSLAFHRPFTGLRCL